MSDLTIAPEDLDISGRESFNPIYVDATGQYHRAPDGSVLNIGGVSAESFTINGKAVVLSDGSLSSGSTAGFLDLQSAYNTSAISGGFATIKLSATKGFAIANTDNTSKYFTIAPNGKTIFHSEVSFESGIAKFLAEYQEAGHLNILPNDGNKIALLIEPKSNVNYATDLVRIKSSNLSEIDFSINNVGETYIRSLQVGSIESPTITDILNQIVNLTEIVNSIDIGGNSEIIAIHQHLNDIDLQIASINQTISDIQSTLTQLEVSGIIGFKFTQLSPSSTWTISHNAGADSIQFSVYDENGRFIHCNDAFALDSNNFIISFGADQLGSAILVCMKTPTEISN